MTPNRKNSMNKQERAAGLLALCLLVLALLCALVPAKAAAFSLRVPPEPTALARLNINEAAREQLEELPGIGPVRAGSILRHRQEQGPLEGPEDLLAVDGIGPATLEEIEMYITY